MSDYAASRQARRLLARAGVSNPPARLWERLASALARDPNGELAQTWIRRAYRTTPTRQLQELVSVGGKVYNVSVI
jgi:hypothetical protein